MRDHVIKNLIRRRFRKFCGPRPILTILMLFVFLYGDLYKAEAAPAKPKSNLLGCDIEFARIGKRSTLTPKTELIASHLQMQFTTPHENLMWMNLAKKSKPDSGLLFGDIEFSVLQKVNTLTNDKNLATSMTNKHKELTFKALDALQKKYGRNIDIITYSDFKSARFAIVPKNKTKTLPSELKADIAKLFDQTNREYSDFIRANDLNVDGDVEKWFRGGIGLTADEANFATRLSRDMGQGNPLRDFEDPEIRRNMASYQRWAEAMRSVDLTPDPSMKSLIEDGFVKDDVLDIVKKNPNPVEARARLKAKYGADLSETQVERLSTYNSIIDHFSPGIHVAERKVASLEKANFGGLSADFSGLGAKNRGATARALAHGKDLREAIALARQGEQEVTKEFEAQTRAFRKVIDRYVVSSISSGDDFVGTAGALMSSETKRNLIRDVAKLETPSAQRLAFISDGVNLGDRNVLAAHGEAIEKVLRQELEGRVPAAKLRQVVFGIDMLGKSAGKGDVSLITGEGAAAGLTEAERLEIRKCFERAVRAFNEKVDKEFSSKTYLAREASKN